MASLSEIASAGLNVSKRGGGAKVASDVVQSFIGGAQSAGDDVEKSQKREAEKQSFYFTLRSNGYSREEAEEKVNSVFTEKQSFLSRVFGKEKALGSFKAPTGDSKFDLQMEEQKARTQKLKAEAATGGANVKDAREQKIAKQQALNLLKSKSAYNSRVGMSFKLGSRDAAINALGAIKGGVDLEDPEIKSALDEAFPDAGGDEMVSVEINGQRGKIPKRNLKAALERGAKVLNG